MGFVASDGAYVTDVKGRRYLDFHAAFGAVTLGYHNAAVDEAVRSAVSNGALYGMGITEPELEFAERVCHAIPSAEMVIACCSGTEATFQAVRLSRAVSGRDYIIKFQGCFHGWHDAVARNVISPPERAYGLDPLSAGIPADALQHTLIAELNDLDSVRSLLQAHPGDVAAVILEPIAHNVGCLVAQDDFLIGLRQLVDEHGTLLIFDEVVTGFRHHVGGFQATSPVLPDLTTFGKGVGNGYPVAGLAGRAELMQRFGPGGDVLLAGTFNGHPVAMAAANATIRVMTEDDPALFDRTASLATRAAEGLNRVIAGLGIRARALSHGSVFVVYFLDGQVSGYRDLLRNDNHAYATFHRRMTDRGFLMLPMALKRNHVSAAHTDADIDAMLATASEVLAGMAMDGTAQG